ncbi:MAG: UvrD-helicase domain-containing protein [Chloroflexi bacterium]|nr:UvrD-helicase domain-containing protein [Chloroflexota bacterium]
MDLLADLNPPQIEATQASDGPVLVLAGPGSGKTRVLTHRIAYLVRERNVFPYHILAVTFTNKAAREMLKRLETLLGAEARQLTIGTFHAVCARILRREANQLGLDRNFVIFDEDDQQKLINRALKDLQIDPKQYKPSSVLGAISNAKNDLLTPHTYAPPTYWHEAVRRIYERYETLKTANNALDFDDLLMRVEELFREHADVLAQYQKRYTYLLVDEFQDTNKAQYEIVKRLAGERRNLFVVGDEDQSIYSWRGADYRNVLRFRQDYVDARVILLEQNYRSTRHILAAAQAVINHNTQRVAKKLWTQNSEGRVIQLFEAYDENEEAEYVVNEVQRLAARHEGSLSQCAVMFRTNAQSRPIEDAFVRHGLPYRLVGGTRFYQRREIKDIIAYLRLVHNPNDEISLARIINVPPRQIGAKTLQDLAQWAAHRGLGQGEALLELGLADNQQALLQSSPFSGRTAAHLVRFAELFAGLVSQKSGHNLTELLQIILHDTGYLEMLSDGTGEGTERIGNVDELSTVALRYNHLELDEALATFLEEVALVSDTDDLDRVGEAVTLLSLHAAKGLEYDTVFMVGMEEGLCPHSRSLNNPDEMEEERRLCYVGMTRARKRLYLIHAFRRTIFGASEVRDPSRFLLDIPENLTEGHSVRTGTNTNFQLPNISSVDRRGLYAARRIEVERAKKAIDDRAMKKSAAPASRSTLQPLSVDNSTSLPKREAVFHAGDKVDHAIFGQGTVISSRIVGDDEEVSVVFEQNGLKRLMASFAKLERR